MKKLLTVPIQNFLVYQISNHQVFLIICIVLNQSFFFLTEISYICTKTSVYLIRHKNQDRLTYASIGLSIRRNHHKHVKTKYQQHVLFVLSSELQNKLATTDNCLILSDLLSLKENHTAYDKTQCSHDNDDVSSLARALLSNCTQVVPVGMPETH